MLGLDTGMCRCCWGHGDIRHIGEAERWLRDERTLKRSVFAIYGFEEEIPIRDGDSCRLSWLGIYLI